MKREKVRGRMAKRGQEEQSYEGDRGKRISTSMATTMKRKAMDGLKN